LHAGPFCRLSLASISLITLDTSFARVTPTLPPPADETGGIVIDVGGANARFGFAGEDMPKAGFNSVRRRVSTQSSRH
jgi:hypothetical protein